MKAEIWNWNKGKIKVYTEDPAQLARIRSWKKAKQHSQYFFRDGRYGEDFILPARLHDKVAEMLGLSKKTKSHRRVENGKRLAETRNFSGFTHSNN